MLPRALKWHLPIWDRKWKSCHADGTRCNHNDLKNIFLETGQVNRWNNSWICTDQMEAPNMMHTNLLWWSLGLSAMRTYFFLQDCRINTTIYTEGTRYGGQTLDWGNARLVTFTLSMKPRNSRLILLTWILWTTTSEIWLRRRQTRNPTILRTHWRLLSGMWWPVCMRTTNSEYVVASKTALKPSSVLRMSLLNKLFLFFWIEHVYKFHLDNIIDFFNNM